MQGVQKDMRTSEVYFGGAGGLRVALAESGRNTEAEVQILRSTSHDSEHISTFHGIIGCASLLLSIVI